MPAPRKYDYRTESPNKKQARLMAHGILENAMGRELYRKGPHLVLASAEAGDISVMLGKGVEPTAIHAVDVDKHALDAAKDRFGSWGVQFKAIDFRKANKEFGVPSYVSAIIDLCSEIRDTDVKAIIDLRAKYKVYGFQVCREKGFNSTFINSVDDGGSKVKPRLQLLAHHGFKTGLAIHYVSRTLTNHGTPMCMAFCSNVRKPSKNPEILSVSWGYHDLDLKLLSKPANTYLLYNVNRQAAAGKKAAKTRAIEKVRGTKR